MWTTKSDTSKPPSSNLVIGKPHLDTTQFGNTFYENWNIMAWEYNCWDIFNFHASSVSQSYHTLKEKWGGRAKVIKEKLRGRPSVGSKKKRQNTNIEKCSRATGGNSEECWLRFWSCVRFGHSTVHCRRVHKSFSIRCTYTRVLSCYNGVEPTGPVWSPNSWFQFCHVPRVGKCEFLVVAVLFSFVGTRFE